MQKATVHASMTLNANSFIPIDLGFLALRTLTIQVRSANDAYIATNPDGTNYWTLKSGTTMTFDLGGGVLDVAEGSELLTNGTFTGSADNWTFDVADWTYNANAIDKDQDGVTTLSQVPVLVAGALYKLSYVVSGAGFVGNLTPSVGGKDTTERTATGSYTDYVFATNATSGVIFTPTNLSRFTLDTISLKRCTYPTNNPPIFIKGSGAHVLEMIGLQ